MNIFDLVGSVTPEVTVNILDLQGNETGEHFKLHHPSSGIMTKALSVYLMAGNKLRRDNDELHKKCEAEKDFTDYNAKVAPEFERLDLAFAVTAVAGWSMDDECTDDAVTDLLTKLPYLAQAVIAAFWQAKADHEKK